MVATSTFNNACLSVRPCFVSVGFLLVSGVSAEVWDHPGIGASAGFPKPSIGQRAGDAELSVTSHSAC